MRDSEHDKGPDLKDPSILAVDRILILSSFCCIWCKTNSINLGTRGELTDLRRKCHNVPWSANHTKNKVHLRVHVSCHRSKKEKGEESLTSVDLKASGDILQFRTSLIKEKKEAIRYLC